MKPLNEYVFPKDLKNMSEYELGLLGYEIRDFLIEKVSKTGGHIASNLGVVELTIALHKVLDLEKDKIVWDVGHQSYVHKILTGRSKDFDSLRKFEGLSGFPKRGESPYDVSDSGHSSTSISIALGMAEARDLKGEDNTVVAVIGDGSLTGGVAFEGMNNAGHQKNNLIVILNDNEMSIGKNIGGMNNHLIKLRTNSTYKKMKTGLRKGIKSIPSIGEGIYHSLEGVRNTLKYAIVDGVVFEELGFTYFGPIDGHNVGELIQAIENAKKTPGPVMLHVLTKKGKGLTGMENRPEEYHGIGPFNPSTLKPESKGDSSPDYTSIVSETLVQLGDQHSDLVAVSAAMCNSTGLSELMKKYPSRVFDVGIAEQHAVSFAAGLALNGMHPFVAIYSTFLQRAYDELLVEVCLQNLPVVFCIDRSGNVGADGETHNGQFDLSYLSHMPNLTVMAPKDGPELEAMMAYAYALKKPCAIRYPKGKAPDLSHRSSNYKIDGKAEVLTQGKDITLLAIGKSVEKALMVRELLAEEGIEATVINQRFIKPLDMDTVTNSIKETNRLITLEDNALIGGFGAMVVNALAEKSIHLKLVKCFGWPDTFIPQGKTEELEVAYGLDSKTITQEIKKYFQ